MSLRRACWAAVAGWCLCGFATPLQTAEDTSHKNTKTKFETVVELQLAKSQFAIGEPIWLVIRMRNIGPGQLTIVSDRGKECITDFELAGKQVATTELGKVCDVAMDRSGVPGIGSRSLIRIQPGETCERFLLLSSLFDLSTAGEYRLHVSDPLMRGDSGRYLWHRVEL